MSGYNKALSLYEPDSDEDSSDGGSMILAIASGRRGSGSSDDFSLPDNMMEREEGNIDMYSALNPSTYNPIGLTIRAGNELTIDGDSDDDGQSVGDDPAYHSLTIADRRAINLGDYDEQSIGSDDEFAPATHSNFPKNVITASDKDFDGMLSVSVGGQQAQANAGGGGGGGADGGGGGEEQRGGGEEQRGGAGGGGGGGGGAKGGSAAAKGSSAAANVRPPQPEVAEALARVLGKASAIGEAARRGVPAEDTAAIQGAFKDATPEQRNEIQALVGRLRSGGETKEEKEFVAKISEKIKKAQAKGKSESEIAKMVERDEKAFAFRQVVSKGKYAAGKEKALVEMRTEGGLKAVRQKAGIELLKGNAEISRVASDLDSAVGTDPKGMVVSESGEAVALDLPVGKVTFGRRGTSGRQATIYVNGVAKAQSDYKVLIEVYKQLVAKHGEDKYLNIQNLLYSRIRQGASIDGFSLAGLGLGKGIRASRRASAQVGKAGGGAKGDTGGASTSQGV